MPRVTITINWPTASMVNMLASVSTLSMFSGPANFGVRMATAAKKSRSGRRAPSSRRRSSARPAIGLTPPPWRRRGSLAVGFAAVEPAGDAPTIHHDDSIGDAEHLLQFRRHKKHGQPPAHHLPDDRVDRGLRGYVDALGRLVENDDAGRGFEPLPDRHLLLIASGQFCYPLHPVRCPDRQGLAYPPGDGELAPRTAEPQHR